LVQGLEPSLELASVLVVSGVFEGTVAAADVAGVAAAGDSFETGCLLEAVVAVVVAAELGVSEVVEPAAGVLLGVLAGQLKAVSGPFAG
jgi:hypothetical protein